MDFTEPPRTAGSTWTTAPSLPDVARDQTVADLFHTLTTYITDIIDVSYTFEQLRIGHGGGLLLPLVDLLANQCHNTNIIATLLIMKWHFSSLSQDGHGANESRGYACEIVAWRLLHHLTERELLDYLLFELPPPHSEPPRSRQTSSDTTDEGISDDEAVETIALLGSPTTAPTLETVMDGLREFVRPSASSDDGNDDPTTPFVGLTALEIAAVVQAKKFLSQRIVQKIIDAIWCGDIIFWDSLNVSTKKKARRYSRRTADLYTRLRVPKYQKFFEAVFLTAFLALYYAVLLERNPDYITPTEVMLYIWIAAYAYDEFGEYNDIGRLFYAADIWNLWDLGILLIGAAFLICRIIGLAQGDEDIIKTSFDILSLEALFLFPRLCSMLSLRPYFGVLIISLTEMARDFLKFLVLVFILYLGFLTAFAMVARDDFSVSYISWVILNVFFGASFLGFDVASRISSIFGVPLMILFVGLTNILLITSLISLLSNSLAKILQQAREEHLFQYSIYILEASSSRRLTYYFPPLNLIPLFLFRPLRLFVPANLVRNARIILLKATHAPYVAIIWAYENTIRRKSDNVGFSPAPSARVASMNTLQSIPHSKSRISNSVKHARRMGLNPLPPNRSEASLNGHFARTSPPQSEASRGGISQTEFEELKRMIAGLSRQVDDLVARLDP